MTTPTDLAVDVAPYSDARRAGEDFDVLKAADGAGLQVMAAVEMSRDGEGRVDVLCEGDGITSGGAVLGGGVGLVAGRFAPLPLAATAVGVGIGALFGHLTGQHAEPPLRVGRRRAPSARSSYRAGVDDCRGRRHGGAGLQAWPLAIVWLSRPWSSTLAGSSRQSETQ